MSAFISKMFYSLLFMARHMHTEISILCPKNICLENITGPVAAQS